ncbi:undecaprenyl-diphosphate phosphatase [Magnetospirillum sulfuroxidans]|uniref:Undecaprenyl-diphosphatase n=1 Tax=Magnetospirillum sulfuroxidans TaxID=611300 RepID=A0ABS5ID43_9PROT|nr:undecaprenyl-diphosphate phosphatase [Magnetospirillum sulfuroxidans]MBR9972340.1 undecaprenyl-diphosphate phosphatase [Magnetospirillum sulfuroxidans]
MTYLDIVLIAVIQGLAGVLPLSATGHFALFSGLAANPQGFAAVSVAAHLGAAAGVALWLWRDCLSMLLGVAKLVKGKSDPGGRLLLLLLAGSLPVGGIAAWLLSEVVPPHGQVLAAVCLLVFGILLALADRWGVTVSRIEHQGYGSVAIIGLLQILAMLPGASRTGIAVTAARLMGFERREAARLSLLLGIPALLGFGLFRLWQMAHSTPLLLSADLVLTAAVAAVAAWIAAGGMLTWLGRHTFLPFCLWRIMLGVGVIALYFLSA